jgi:hypothetical protein
MNSAPPAWSYPLILALLGIVLATGRFPTVLAVAIGVETAAFLGYLLYRSHREPAEARTVARLLPLFPGHLLLLFALGTLPGVWMGWIILWMVVPAATILYDLLGSRARGRARASILAGLYVMIWTAVFVLLERVIALGRGLQGREEIPVMAVVGGVALVFLVIGVYRHLLASKCSKE